jgi:hypothetical protein
MATSIWVITMLLHPMQARLMQQQQTTAKSVRAFSCYGIGRFLDIASKGVASNFQEEGVSLFPNVYCILRLW